MREADAVSLRRFDEIGGHPRPAGIGRTYAELEYDALADEQELAWPAEGERDARPFAARARGLDSPAAATEFLLAQSEKEVQAAHVDYQHAGKILTPYVRHESWAKLRYWICWPVLWLGDMAGVWSAAVANGDIPAIAFGQACAAGLAGACAGLVGAELKHRQMMRARQRDPETLTEDERRYQGLFTGGTGGVGVVKLVGGLSVTVVVLLAVAIFNLRSSVEGTAAGLTFGLLAAATAIASGLLGYSAADEVADLLATMAKRVARAEKRHVRLGATPAIKARAEADETARSIQAEYGLRGQAAGKRVESLNWRVMRRNAQVVGHGFPTGEQSGVIGRRPRRGSGAA
ncbi:MAG TPA: hypothetical protein VHX38_41245 [Pseudonocardiaceae bacterium]|nr:hypothetical protein [Pseudonocardiaceae bacterium]